MIYDRCPQGHRYSGHLVNSNGRRYQSCQTCRAAATRRYRARLGGAPADVLVSSAPTVAMLRALCRMAWPVVELASRIDIKPHRIYALTGKWQITENVHRSLAEKVRATYNELSMIHGPSPRTAAWAKRRKWSPPLDLDDDELEW